MIARPVNGASRASSFSVLTLTAAAALAMSGCGGGGSGGPTPVPPQTYSLSGSVSGLISSGLMLSVNGTTVTVASNATTVALAS